MYTLLRVLVRYMFVFINEICLYIVFYNAIMSNVFVHFVIKCAKERILCYQMLVSLEALKYKCQNEFIFCLHFEMPW